MSSPKSQSAPYMSRATTIKKSSEIMWSNEILTENKARTILFWRYHRPLSPARRRSVIGQRERARGTHLEANDLSIYHDDGKKKESGYVTWSDWHHFGTFFSLFLFGGRSMAVKRDVVGPGDTPWLRFSCLLFVSSFASGKNANALALAYDDAPAIITLH